MGAEWQALASLWLRAEKALFRSSRTDLSFDEVHKSSILEEWKDWIYAKIMKTDAKRPSASFRKAFTNYLGGLPSDTVAIGGAVMDNIWCRPGKTGILGLMLCLYWQGEYSALGMIGMQIFSAFKEFLTQSLRNPSCKIILTVYFVQLLLTTAGKGQNAIELPVEEMAHRSTSVLNFA